MSNKKVIITGGSRGIGRSCVEYFSDLGYKVAFTYCNSESKAKDLVDICGAYCQRLDVADKDSVNKVISELIEKLEGVDVLINNAGISQFELFDKIDEENWENMLNTNLGGCYRCTRAVVPTMISQKSGNIINVSSIWGITGASCESHYSASKSGIIGLTKSLAKELGPSGIRVNCVAPGVIDTDMNSHLDKAAIDELSSSTPLNRIGSALEVAKVIEFLASDNSSFITGQTICVDGGISV